MRSEKKIRKEKKEVLRIIKNIEKNDGRADYWHGQNVALGWGLKEDWCVFGIKEIKQ